MKAQNRFWRILRNVARLAWMAPATRRGSGAHQRNAGRFHGDVGAGAHGDADVGGRQGGRIVDAVAEHADDLASAVQLLHGLGLAIGPDAAAGFIDTDLPADFLGDQFRIAREHHGADAHRLQGLHRLEGFRAQRVGNGHDPQHAVAIGDEHDGAALLFPVPSLAASAPDVDPCVVQQARVADHDLAPVHRAADATAGDAAKIRHGLGAQAQFGRPIA